MKHIEYLYYLKYLWVNKKGAKNILESLNNIP